MIDSNQPENNEEPALVEAERLYEKMIENIANRVVTDLSDNISSISSFTQKESSEQNSDDMRTSSAFSFTKEHTLSDPEDEGMERNLFQERSDVAGHRIIFSPYRGEMKFIKEKVIPEYYNSTGMGIHLDANYSDGEEYTDSE